MSQDIPALEIQIEIANSSEIGVVRARFDCFKDLNEFIKENPVEAEEFDGYAVGGANVSYRMAPKGSSLDGDDNWCDTPFGWEPLSSREIFLIIEDYQASIDVESMCPHGIPCVLRLFIEDMDSKLLMERDFVSFDELNAFIAENPDLEELAGTENPAAILGVVETVGGKPCRVPLAITDDDGLGIFWEEQTLGRCKHMMVTYNRGYEEREQVALGRLSERDREDLASEEPSLKAELLLAVVHNLIRKRYGVAYAQTGGLIRSWEDGFGPFLEDLEIVFDDRYEFPVPMPRLIPYSQAFCKVTATAGLYDNRELREQLRPMVEREAGAALEELGSDAIPYIDRAMDEWTLRTLLEWSEALPERP